MSEQVQATDAADEVAPASRRSKGYLIGTILLSVALVGALVAFGIFFVRFTEASELIDEQQQELEEQRELIEKKESFGAAMDSLLETANAFDGTLFSSLVPIESYQAVAKRAWLHRWSLTSLDGDIRSAEIAKADLEALLAEASEQVSSNATGSTYEAVSDQLGAGFVITVIDNADALCEQDVWGCVGSEDPFTVHIDAADVSLPYMTDWLRTGLAYHEFAHVLQFTNSDQTELAVAAFGGDVETMADCFALTYLNGWTLDHEIWINDFEYWEVEVGYGYTCNDSQRQVVRDWYSQLGYTPATISQ